MIEATFTADGFLVLAAHDGPADVERVVTERSDPVLLDVSLPSTKVSTCSNSSERQPGRCRS